MVVAATPSTGMAVCLDRRVLGRSGGTGVATYSANLELAARDAGCRIELLSDQEGGRTGRGGGELSRAWRWAEAALPWPRRLTHSGGSGIHAQRDIFRIAQVHFDIYRRFAQLRPVRPPTLMHWSYPLPMRLLGCPNIVTIHDLIPLRHPNLSPIPQQRWRRMLERLANEADHIVTVSETSRRDIIGELGWSPEKVTNAFQSVELPGWSEAEAVEITSNAAQAAGVQPGEYLIHVGTIEKRKNIARLIEAHRVSKVPYPLVLAGPDGWQAEAELNAASDRQGANRIVRVLWLPRTALLGLMRGARALLAPSLAEGFGLPALEAMALGIPVLTGAVDATGDPGACAEIAGNAAILVDPTDTAEIARGISAIALDDVLRARCIAVGRNRARLYSRAAYAERLRMLYAKVCVERPHFVAECT